MAKQLCPPNVTSDQINYADPIPMVGLYISVASMVCFLLIILDVINGFRKKKLWFPCHFFSLNSVTLALLSIAAKLQVDLTTLMPSAQDQLSKLTGTVLICVSMGFFMPSTIANRPSEYLTNLIALSILVVTVIVNICIQISTGVIFAFIVEHVIIMFCMFMVLCFLWTNSNIKDDKVNSIDRSKDIFTKGRGSMLRQLKICYLHEYYSDSQFVTSIEYIQNCINLMFIACLVVVLQATFRSLIGHEFTFCSGASDYGWSMKFIVVSQILVILLGSLATGIRWLFVSGHLGEFVSEERFLDQDINDVILKSDPFLKDNSDDEDKPIWLMLVHAFSVVGFYMAVLVLFLPSCIIYVLHVCIQKCICRSCTRKCVESEVVEDYRVILRENGIVLDKWTLRKCVEDIDRWIGASKSDSLLHLPRLLSERTPSQQSLQQLRAQYDSKERNEISCLYLVFLARIASVVAPLSSPTVHLTQSLHEVFDIIYFIDNKVNSLLFNNIKKCKLAKAMWNGEDFSSVLPKIFNGATDEPCQPQSDLDRALKIVRELKNVLPSPFIWDEVGIIMDFITKQEYSSIEELYGHMEQIFVDMLHIFLAQLPYAIFKEIIESPSDEYGERVRLMLKFLLQIESLENNVQWYFPFESNFTSLISTPGSITGPQNNTTICDNASDVVATHVVIEDVDH